MFEFNNLKTTNKYKALEKFLRVVYFVFVAIILGSEIVIALGV